MEISGFAVLYHNRLLDAAALLQSFETLFLGPINWAMLEIRQSVSCLACQEFLQNANTAKKAT